MRLRPKVSVSKTGLLAGELKGKLAAMLRGPDRVRVGIPDGPIADIAIYNEFGTRTIPERPFLRNAIRANRGKYQAAMGAAAREILKDALFGEDVAASKLQALQKLGVIAQGDVQAEITSLSSPPNAPSTIRQKGSSKPLIDTGRLRQSITYTVEEG